MGSGYTLYKLELTAHARLDMEWERSRSDLAEGLRRRLAWLDVDGVRLVARRRAARRLGLPLALAAAADEHDAADEEDAAADRHRDHEDQHGAGEEEACAEDVARRLAVVARVGVAAIAAGGGGRRALRSRILRRYPLRYTLRHAAHDRVPA